MTTYQAIDNAYRAALEGERLSREQIIQLLSMDSHSEECAMLRKAAHRASLLLTDNRAYMWGAIGLDYAACAMNCDFCSFGQAWGLIGQEKIYTLDEIIDRVKEYVGRGVHFIVLRTTQHYSLKTIGEYAAAIRAAVEGNYEIVVNVGEFDSAKADMLYGSGVSGVYHAIRLREGVDTRFDVAAREATLSAVRDSKLNLIHLVEPIGLEHTYEEIADRFLNLIEYGTYISGVMARIPVAGTPLGDGPRLSDEEIAKMIAVMRLSGGSTIKHICVHPASELAVMSGANVVVIETGAIPRDQALAEGKWRQFDCEVARELFERCGYSV
ncbi:MAG: hypothetical protein J6C60_02160 [Alistipes sp.]|nr:hypothetical protein [Alistipes sp.]MBO5399492.1 hypothetical protein [Alistipes sp.]